MHPADTDYRTAKPKRMSLYFDASSAFLNEDQSASETIAMDDKRMKVGKFLANFEKNIRTVFALVQKHSDFNSKYDVSARNPFVYVYTKQAKEFTFLAEVFPVVQLPLLANKLTDELTFHSMFENVIERYTYERRKPNPVLQETRASDFCYQLTVKFEAIPMEKSMYTESHQLLREFQALQHLWESYRTELGARKCTADQLVGFPMPFEFVNVVGSPTYDFPTKTMDGFSYYSLTGKFEKIRLQPVSSFGFGSDSKNIMSSLSYMSIEKVGPNLTYLMELMQSQGQRFSVSSALKIYDQLISRLMILHKYGMTHCDINPKCLNFGCREATNVLYINSFDKAVLCSSQSSPLPFFHDRFASYMQVKERKCHYLCDLESAFYVFVYMLLDRLPWDSRLTKSDDKQEVPVQDAVTRKSKTTDLKEKFWSSSESFRWVINSVTYEYQEALYCNFSIDVLETLYARMKESITACLNMSPGAFFKEICIAGSAPYNCYFGMRKVIASYFRFENLNQSMKDVTCTSKLALLAKQDSVDKRVAWDLSYWCWNCLDTDPEKKRR